MKKILWNLVILLTCVFALTGCAKCISTETSTVQVKVTDEYYEAAHTALEYNVIYDMPMLKTVPTKYRITVEYNDIEYNFTDEDTYNKYSNRIGEYVNGILEIKKYDNGQQNTISLT